MNEALDSDGGKSVAASAKRIRRIVWTISLLSLLFYVGYVVWPTPYTYRYERVLDRYFMIRTHRITGATAVAAAASEAHWTSTVKNPFSCRVTWKKVN